MTATSRRKSVTKMLLPVGVSTPFAGSCAGWQQVAHDCLPVCGCMDVGARRRRHRHKQTPTPTNGAVDVSSWQEAVDDEMETSTAAYRGDGPHHQRRHRLAPQGIPKTNYECVPWCRWGWGYALESSQAPQRSRRDSAGLPRQPTNSKKYCRIISDKFCRFIPDF